MTIVADVVMAAWIPIVLLLFAVVPPRNAVILAYMVGWLFLPFHSYSLPLIPDFTKMSATSFGVAFGAIVFDGSRFTKFRLHWSDLPIAIYCAVPFVSSLTNGLGAYDGVSAATNRAIVWGLPYLIGRMYFNDWDGVRALVIAIFVGGLAYIPFCLFEIRMSPQLHSMVYGSIHRVAGGATVRLGGYRPAVFLDSGLQLGLWMTICSLTGFWLWRAKAVTHIARMPVSLLATMLILVTLLCRSTGALTLLFVAIGSLVFSRVTGTRVLLWCFLLVAPLYIVTRVTGIWDGSQVTSAAKQVDMDRALSLQFRFDNETILLAKAVSKPYFGWGGWGRNRVYTDDGIDISVPDGLWIQCLGSNGFVGLATFYLALLLPAGRCIRAHPNVRTFMNSPAAPLAIGAIIYSIDCLLNAMENPLNVLGVGALSGTFCGEAVNPSKLATTHVERRSALPARLWPRGDSGAELNVQ